MVRHYMEDAKLPSHEDELIEEEEVDIPTLWRLMKSFLGGMIVEGCKLLALDRLRKLVRTQGESDLGLVHCAQMIYQTSDMPVSKK